MITALTRASRARASRGGTALDMVTERKVRYTIYNVAAPAFSSSEPTLARIVAERSIVVVVDDVVWQYYRDEIERYFSEHADVLATLVISGSEADKDWQAVEGICRSAIAHGLDRNGMLVAIGGGVVLDVAGVAASLYRRGIRYVRVATTLIAAVDVAVGIKQAFNYAGKKSALGAFYPPVAAVVDRRFLRTLPRRAISCGIAEIAKVAIVRDAVLFELLESSGPTVLESRFQSPRDAADEIIVRAQCAMMDDLEPNLYEDHLCRLVDFGHTFSPMIEAASGYSTPHGEAVAIDMLLAIAIAVGRQICDPSLFDRVASLYRDVSLPFGHPLVSVDLLSRALADTRRHRGNNDNFVVPVAIGSATFIQDIGTDELGAAIAYVNDRL